MNILTWNINGIRAMNEGLSDLLKKLNADILCFQETKVTRDQLDEPSAIVEGYSSYFSFSKVRSGYSGVATFVKDNATPLKAEEGLTGLLASSQYEDNIGCYGDQSEFDDDELQSLDNEGRTIITQHKIQTDNGEELLSVINVYCPRADPEREDRKLYKMRFYELLEGRALELLRNGSHVIILGDVNTSHKRIDSCDPAEDFEERPTRKWMNQLLWDPELPEKEQHDEDSHLFIDSFRYFHPDQEKAYTCWNTMTGARATNYGTRIDYIFGNKSLVNENFTESVILPDVEGSDHCPVKATLKCAMIPAKKCPKLCTKFLPEFSGKQQTLSAFLIRKPRHELNEESISKDTTAIKRARSKAPDITESKYFSKSVPTLKRTSSSQSGQASKKLKQNDKKPSTGKGGTLLGFFNKTQSKSDTKNVHSKIGMNTTDESDIGSQSSQSATDSQTSTKTKDVNDMKKVDSNLNSVLPLNLKKDRTVAINSWKNLLKGPPPAPPCKGHKEPCVLRTVKKDDSLNKGRQFWVCQKPDGEKNNPLARCDHFEWVEKKKKKKDA